MPPDTPAARPKQTSGAPAATPGTDLPAKDTADAKAAAGTPVGSAADPQSTKDGSTHTSDDGHASPRQPNEHDESSDSGTRPPDPKIAQAAEDVDSGKQPTDRGETTDEVYARNLRGSAGDGR